MTPDLTLSLRNISPYKDALIERVLKKGLNDRVDVMTMQRAGDTLVFEFSVSDIHGFRVLDKGPAAADDKQASDAFRAFWGGKSQLRRFKDAMLCEALLWDGTYEDEGATQEDKAFLVKSTGVDDLQIKYLILPRIILYVLKRHLNLDNLHNNVSFGNVWLYKWITDKNDITEIFNAFERKLKGIACPLTLQSCRALIDLTAVRHEPLPRPADALKNKKQLPSGCVPVLDVLLQVESSTSWPVETRASFCLLSAYLLHLSKHLRLDDEFFWTSIHAELPVSASISEDASVSPSIQWPPYMDVWYEGFIFRCWLDAREMLSVPDAGTYTRKLVSWWPDFSPALAAEATYSGADKDTFLFWDFRDTLAHLSLVGIVKKRFPSWQDYKTVMTLFLSQHFLSLPTHLIDILCIHGAALTHPDEEETPHGHTPYSLFCRALAAFSSIKLTDSSIIVAPARVDSDLSVPFATEEELSLYIQSLRDYTSESLAFVYCPRRLVYFFPLYQMKRLIAISGAALKAISSPTPLSIFKHDTSEFDAVFTLDVKAAMVKMRKHAIDALVENGQSSLSRLDLLAHVFLPGFNPLEPLLFELKDQVAISLKDNIVQIGIKGDPDRIQEIKDTYPQLLKLN